MSRTRAAGVGRAPPATCAATPTALDLLIDPELAPLVLLEAASHVLIQALVAANPDMLPCAEQPATVLDPVPLAAHGVVAACRELHEALANYRARVRDCRARHDDDDIPF
jgi:hypothetical protein